MSIGVIAGAIISIAQAGGWFSKAEWSEEIVGKLTNNHAEGGIIDELESLSARTYPNLRQLRQTVVDDWRAFQSAAPWDKAKTAEAYQARVRQLANEVSRELKARTDVANITTAIGGAFASPDWWKKYLPWFGIGATAIVLVIILSKKGKKRR